MLPSIAFALTLDIWLEPVSLVCNRNTIRTLKVVGKQTEGTLRPWAKLRM